jgi:hypothetical protein
VDSLLKIIKSKKLRFNNLTLMDDPDEPIAKDFKRAGRWVFISSWTTKSNNRPMFREYGDNFKGVCYSLPHYPFFTVFGNPFFKNSKVMRFNKNGKELIKPFLYTKGIEEYIGYYDLIFYPYNVECLKVKYTDDPQKLYPKVANYTYPTRSYYDKELGIYKDTTWSYQEEIRYRLRPSFLDLDKIGFIDRNYIGNRMIDTKEYGQCPVSHIDIPIDLTGLEIFIGPALKGQQRESVLKKINALCPTAILKNSSLKIKM